MNFSLVEARLTRKANPRPVEVGVRLICLNAGGAIVLPLPALFPTIPTFNPAEFETCCIEQSPGIQPASSQSPLEALAGLKFCKTLKDDAQRLKCFDGIELSSPQAPDSSKVDADPEWKIDESKSPIDDSPQVTASLSESKGQALLVLRCREHSTEAIFSKPFTFLGSSTPIKVLVRINETKPIETRWSPSTTGTGAFAPSPVEFIRALPDDGKLFLRATGYSQIADAEFKLDKVSEVRARISEACKWPAASR